MNTIYSFLVSLIGISPLDDPIGFFYSFLLVLWLVYLFFNLIFFILKGGK